MQCKNCSAQFTDGSLFCPECGAAQDVPVSKVNPETAGASPELSQASPESPEQIPNSRKAKIFVLRQINDYLNFKSLSPKSKFLHIALPVICLLLLYSVFSGGLFKNYKNDSELAMGCAVMQIKKQTYSRYEPDVYDVELVDSDGCGRFIITASSGDNPTWPTRWAVIVQLNSDNETYGAVANYHGGGISQSDWVEAYKTEAEYDWGVEQE